MGAGKTAVSRELLSSDENGTVYIEGDVFWSFIVNAAEGQEPAKRFTMVMRAMLSAARHFARDGYDVIVDFSIPPWYLPATRALLKDTPFDFAVLLPSREVCEARAASRIEGKIADYATYGEFYDSFDGAERFTIRDDGAGPATLAARIRAGVAAGTFRIS